jgi:hypothetical protein
MAQKFRTIAVPAAGGAAVVIRCTQMTEAMSISESGLTPQGFIYQALTPTNAAVANAWTVGPAIIVPANSPLQPIIFQQKLNDHSPNRINIGGPGSFPNPVAPGGPVTNGTPIVQVTSATATPTTITVIEE